MARRRWCHKPVGFDRDDYHDMALLNYARSMPNFTSSVKRWLESEMNKDLVESLKVDKLVLSDINKRGSAEIQNSFVPSNKAVVTLGVQKENILSCNVVQQSYNNEKSKLEPVQFLL